MSGLRDARRACELEQALEESDELLAALSARTEECERLKCCGNCGRNGYHFGAFGCFPAVSPLFVDTNPADRCHFTPSQWTPRQEATP